MDHSQASPRCVSCGYELTGITVESRCPECGQPVWGSAQAKPTSGYAIASLVLGILSTVSCVLYGVPPLIFGTLGVIFGEIAVRHAKQGRAGGSTRGMALAGRICSWVGLAVSITVILAIVIMMMM